MSLGEEEIRTGTGTEGKLGEDAGRRRLSTRPGERPQQEGPSPCLGRVLQFCSRLILKLISTQWEFTERPCCLPLHLISKLAQSQSYLCVHTCECHGLGNWFRLSYGSSSRFMTIAWLKLDMSKFSVIEHGVSRGNRSGEEGFEPGCPNTI